MKFPEIGNFSQYYIHENRGDFCSAHALVGISVWYTNREIVAGIRTLAEILKSNL